MAAIKDSNPNLKLRRSRIVKDVLRTAWRRVTRPRRSFEVLRIRKESDIRSEPGAGENAEWLFAASQRSRDLVRTRRVPEAQAAEILDVHPACVSRGQVEEHAGVDAESEVASLGGHADEGEDTAQEVTSAELLDAHARDEPLEMSPGEGSNADGNTTVASALSDMTDSINDLVNHMAESNARMRDNFRATGLAIDATNAHLEAMNRRSVATLNPPRTTPKKMHNSSWQTIPMAQCTTCELEPDREEQFPEVPQACMGLHDAETCSSCWQQWLEAQVGSQSYDQISCVQCSNKLTQLDIRRLATKTVFGQYLDSEVKGILATDSTFMWCPKSNCTSGQLHHGNHIFTCAGCNHKHCIGCRVDWHGGETCSEYQKKMKEYDMLDRAVLIERLRREEVSTANMIDEKTKLCPGAGCGRRVEKVSGCDHVVCTKCKFSFCWLCLASHQNILDEGNTAHKIDCKYHSNNLKVAYPFNVH